MTAKHLIKIGEVSFPLEDYAIVGNAILGIRGAGKTYLAKSIAEQLLDHSVPIIAFDPIGVWRHLRRAADRNGKGFKIVVAGGEEPDLPLTPESAPEIVRAAIRENIPLVIDLYSPRLSKADWRRIVRSCFRTLMYENKGVRHILLEETAEFAPQRIDDGETYAEVEKVVRMGGNVSLGITLINQRAQEVNKAVLDLCDNLILMRQRGQKAIEQVGKWMEHLNPDAAKGIARGLPDMENGDAWIFKGTGEEPQLTKAAPLRSFHPDRRRPELVKVAGTVADTGDFVSRMSSELTKVIEVSKSEDPKALRAEIAALKRQLSQGGEDQLSVYQEEVKSLRSLMAEYEATLARVRSAISGISGQCSAIMSNTGITPPPIRSLPITRMVPKRLVQKPALIPVAVPKLSGDLGEGPTNTLKAIAQYATGVTHRQLAALTGYARRTVSNNMIVLRKAGCVTDGWPTLCTLQGHALLGPSYERLPEGDALLQHWLAELPEGPSQTLLAISTTGYDGISITDLAKRTNYAERTVSNNLTALRSRCLIKKVGNRVALIDDLFDA